MILGHYASALLPYTKFKKYPFWILLLCANVPEFFWLFLAFLGIEPAFPSSLFDATFHNLQVQMTYSHNLIPAFIQGGIVSLAIYFIYKDRAFSIWCGFLTLFHVLCDLIVGFEHQLLGRDSPVVSLNSYSYFPHGAILIEFLFSLVCIFWYVRAEKKNGSPVSRRKLILLLLIFGIGILMWLPNATVSMRSMLPF
ncbi:hypothetical protein [Leptospira santarosai]|uniref:Uncharacterized protein n=6 Tax=Leptospira santarosai TaxID=28183 RepID=A0AB73LPD0_9LEPT|nr:hypothetical protein [Leptospira santarosai]AVV51843.1 Uncharacterized protein XB17_03277 [Leptospira santarosai]AVV78495.1 Uncharacterized protein XB15_00704 [Leptospira santarosai]EKO33802.1 hypothetical protein LEP1GSC179_2859 [Leptospira santarosai str. MOR084]EKR91631.1 hypothetical protein LEP1GSC163_2969 [Leptospira santarosai str. CBC379]EKT88122.1 hypothetical protein LSS_04019 [Leptospira santarosai serovar Shermani str. LT 821]